MQVLFSVENIDVKLTDLCVDFLSLTLTNTQLADFIHLKELFQKYGLKSTGLFKLLLKGFYIEKTDLLVIYVKNLKLVEYFKQTYTSLTYISNIEKTIYKLLNKNIDSNKFIIEKHEILSDNENDKNIIEQILKLKIDNIYCITLKDNIERQQKVLKQCSQLGLTIEFVKVDKNQENPTEGCLRSHLFCVNDAKNKSYNNVLILEDDFMFSFQNIEWFLSKKLHINIPEDFDMLYLGYNVNNGYRYDENLLKLASAQCTHSYILNQKIYDYILENI